MYLVVVRGCTRVRGRVCVCVGGNWRRRVGGLGRRRVAPLSFVVIIVATLKDVAFSMVVRKAYPPLEPGLRRVVDEHFCVVVVQDSPSATPRLPPGGNAPR